jgi:hypothetical protein
MKTDAGGMRWEMKSKIGEGEGEGDEEEAEAEAVEGEENAMMRMR